jgi:hypothetical protein
MRSLTLQEVLNPVKTGEETEPVQEAQGMTIKEIADLCGAEVHTIRNWINKDGFLKENFTLRNAIKEKLEGGSPEIPSSYTLEETLAIIGEGGGNKTLASLLADNAKLKAMQNNPEMIIRRAVQLIKGDMYSLPQLNGKLIAPVVNAADDVRRLQEKYRDSDKVAKQDALRLFRCAIILRDHYYDMVPSFDRLTLQNAAWEEKIAVLLKYIAATGKNRAEGGSAPEFGTKEFLDGQWEFFHTGGYKQGAVEELEALEDTVGLNEAVLDALVEREKLVPAYASLPKHLLEFKKEKTTA